MSPKTHFHKLFAQLCIHKPFILLSYGGTCTKTKQKASSQSNSMFHLPEGFSPLLSMFSLELPPLILKCLASPIFTLCCFHYAKTKLVAGLMCYLHLFRWEMGLRKLICPPLAGTYEKLFFQKYHQSHTDRTTCLCYRKPQRQSILSDRERISLFFLPAEPHCILRECDKCINHCDFWIDGHKIEHSFQMCGQKTN